MLGFKIVFQEKCSASALVIGGVSVNPSLACKGIPYSLYIPAAHGDPGLRLSDLPTATERIVRHSEAVL
jgi:hypothetical protein